MKKAAADHNLYREYNFSRDEAFDPRLTDSLEKGIDISFEIEWDMGEDPLEVAREKEMAACKKSIRYAREMLKIG